MFTGEDKIEDYKGLYDEYVVKKNPKKDAAKPSKPGSKSTKKDGVKTQGKIAADPGKTKTISKDGKAAPPRPQAKNIVKSGDGKIGKAEPLWAQKRVVGDKLSAAKVVQT